MKDNWETLYFSCNSNLKQQYKAVNVDKVRCILQRINDDGSVFWTKDYTKERIERNILQNIWYLVKEGI